jgi:hypothetical protein
MPMRVAAAFRLLMLSCLLASAGAMAYTPESGIYWNPDEPCSGYTIEIQDNLLVLSFYGGDETGQPLWYTAVGFLTGNALFSNKPLDLTIGSQCAGCAYPGLPTVQAGVGGTVSLTFDPDDNTRATLTWGNGRTVQIERYAFYLKRPEDGAAPPLEATKMLGEWQVVADFSESATADFPYYGDVLVFDVLDFDAPTSEWYFDGCRADNSQDGGCSENALAFHSASGYYDESNGLHVVVVDDSTDTFALYLNQTGTNAGEGEITVYTKGSNPANFAAYPVQAFRTASRTFVQEGVGPSKAQTGLAAKPGLGDVMRPQQAKLGSHSRFDRDQLLPVIRGLERKLQEKRIPR